MGTAWDLVLRGIHIIFAIVILALSAKLVADTDDALPILPWAVFVGVISLISGIVGLASNWIQFLEGMFLIIFDGTVLGVNLISGIIMAHKREEIGCTTHDDYEELPGPGRDLIISFCKQYEADFAFMFLTAAVLAVAFTLDFLRYRRGY